MVESRIGCVSGLPCRECPPSPGAPPGFRAGNSRVSKTTYDNCCWAPSVCHVTPWEGPSGARDLPLFAAPLLTRIPIPPPPPPARSFGFLRRWPLRLHLASFDRPTDRPTTLAGGFHFLRLDGSVFESTVPLTLARSSSSEPSSPTHRERASYELLLTTFWLPSSYGTMT